MFDKELKATFNSTNNISNDSETILTPKNRKQLLRCKNKEKLNKKLFSVLDKTNIIQGNLSNSLQSMVEYLCFLEKGKKRQ